MFFNCSNLQSIDLSSFTTENVVDMSDLFHDCTSLTSINLNSFTIEYVEKLDGMFYNCRSLVYLDIATFKSPDNKNLSLFYNIPKEGTIVVDKDFQDYIQIPDGWKIIN